MQSKFRNFSVTGPVAAFDAICGRVAAVVLSLFASTAAALPLEGRTVEISNQGYVIPFNVLVGPGAEVGSFGGLDSIDLYDVDVNTGRVVIEVRISAGFAPAPNRVRFFDVNDSMPAIVGVTLNGAGTSHPNAGADRIFFGENFFEYEFGGLVGGPGSIMLDVAFAESSSTLADLSLVSQLVAGCKSVAGRVTLAAPALPGGVVVSVSDTLASATPPATVTIAEGATSKSFTIKTAPVAANESGNVTVSLDGASLSQPLTVRPMGLTSLAFAPTSVVGGNPVVGKATLECKAGPGAILLDLSSSNGAVANPVAASIAVPQGLSSATFDVVTNAVLAKSAATISGIANGITKSKKLTVNVAASVSPTSLKFGSVNVGAISATQFITLSNSGTGPFSVTGVGLTGTSASWFVLQSNTCSANLPAGGTCTIGVQFKPLAAASKSAKLSIATSASSTPLSVSLSGTGVQP